MRCPYVKKGMGNSRHTAFPFLFYFIKIWRQKGILQIAVGKIHKWYSFLFRIPKLRTSKMFLHIGNVQERNRPPCAIHSASRAFAGILAVELLETGRTLRSSKLLHIHKSEYHLCILPIPFLKSSFDTRILSGKFTIVIIATAVKMC